MPAQLPGVAQVGLLRIDSETGVRVECIYMAVGPCLATTVRGTISGRCSGSVESTADGPAEAACGSSLARPGPPSCAHSPVPMAPHPGPPAHKETTRKLLLHQVRSGQVCHSAKI